MTCLSMPKQSTNLERVNFNERLYYFFVLDDVQNGHAFVSGQMPFHCSAVDKNSLILTASLFTFWYGIINGLLPATCVNNKVRVNFMLILNHFYFCTVCFESQK